MKYTLAQGYQGQIVRAVQAALGVPADGNFGPITDGAVQNVQLRAGLDTDGTVGSQTFAALGVPEPLFGVDVSKWQRRIDWTALKAAGVHWCYARATQGAGYNDPLTASHVAGANAAGIPIGLYHFATPREHSAADEAAHFVAVCKAIPGETLVPMLDLEDPQGLGSVALSQWATDWLIAVEKSCGRAPMLYCNDMILHMLRAAGWLPPGGCQVWPARYSGRTDDPALDLRPFTGWAAWQFSGSGKLPGLDGQFDFDWLAGGQPALDAMRLPAQE